MGDGQSDARAEMERGGWEVCYGQPQVPMTRPKIVCICGSSRFVDISAVKAWEFNKRGFATFFMPLLPKWYPGVRADHQAEAEGVAAILDNLWLRLIEIADLIFVVNYHGYIGERTKIEIAHAKHIGKPVEYLEALIPNHVKGDT